MLPFFRFAILCLMITIIILTKDNQETIKKTLDSVQSFSEVLLIDTGSNDNTLAIAGQYPNVKIYKKSFTSFGSLRNEVAKLASNEWICPIDSDEIMSKELIDEIKHTPLNENCVYSFLRVNYLNGKEIRSTSWYPEYVSRLYHRDRCCFSDSFVHETLLTSGMEIYHLRSPLFHFPYRSFDDFLKKMELYTTLFADQYRHKKSSSLGKALFHSFFAFFKNYILKKGFLGGKEGLIISLYNGHTTFYKYLKLWERNQKS